MSGNMFDQMAVDGDSEAFHGVRFPAMPLPGQAGALASSLALAMDVPRSTAQRRRDSVLATAPTTFETWAVNGGPADRR